MPYHLNNDLFRVRRGLVSSGHWSLMIIMMMTVSNFVFTIQNFLVVHWIADLLLNMKCLKGFPNRSSKSQNSIHNTSLILFSPRHQCLRHEIETNMAVEKSCFSYFFKCFVFMRIQICSIFVFLCFESESEHRGEWKSEQDNRYRLWK